MVPTVVIQGDLRVTADAAEAPRPSEIVLETGPARTGARHVGRVISRALHLIRYGASGSPNNVDQAWEWLAEDDMAELIVDGDDLVVRLRPVEMIEAVHGEVRVPLRSVRTVEVLDDAEGAVHGLRVGTGIPGSVAIGTFTSRHDKTFAVVHHDTRRGVRVGLEGAQFDELIVGCEDPEAVAASLRAD